MAAAGWRAYSGKIVLAILALGAGILCTAMYRVKARMRAESPGMECEARLSFLANAARAYEAKFHAWPDATGPAFWQAIVSESGEAKRRKTDVFRCPVTGRLYRGPAARPAAGAWLGCCEPGTHSNNVLAITSEFRVEAAPRDDPRLQATSER